MKNLAVVILAIVLLGSFISPNEAPTPFEVEQDYAYIFSDNENAPTGVFGDKPLHSFTLRVLEVKGDWIKGKVQLSQYPPIWMNTNAMDGYWIEQRKE